MREFLLRQYEKVHRYDNWMRRHFTFSGHLFVTFMIAAAVFGIDTRSSTTYQLFVFLAILLILAIINSRFGGLKLQIERQLPRYASVDEPLQYKIILTNQIANSYDGLALIEQLAEPRPTFTELAAFYQLHKQPRLKRNISFRQWRYFLAYQRGGTLTETAVPFLAQSPLTLSLSFTPTHRGKLTFVSTLIAKPDLFGLFRSLTAYTNLQTCLVLPKRYPLKPINLPGKRRYQVGGVSLANSVGDSTEFMSLRDYQAGDALNTIDWKSYAKHGQLIVKEYQDEYFVRRALILDTFIGSASLSQFEAAVSVAASIAMSERQNDALLDLMFVGQQIYCFTAGRGIDHQPHLQEILASVQPSQSGFSCLQQAVMARAALCSSFVCVFLTWDEDRQELVRQLLIHHLPVAVFLVHDGTLKRSDCANLPSHFYLLDYQHLGRDLAVL